MTKSGLHDFSSASVLVVGDVMLDRYWHGQSQRISPEAPVVVVNVQQEEVRLGGAGNVAANVASLGAKVFLMGLIGNDHAGQQMKDLLDEKNIVCHLMTVDQAQTIVKNRVISRQQQMIRLDFESPMGDWPKHEFLQKFESLLPNVNAVVLSDYAKGTLVDIDRLIKLARKNNIPVLADTKGTTFQKYKHATVITPNLHEFETVVGHCSEVHDLELKGEALRASLQLDAVLVTRSEKGMSLISKDQNPLHIPTEAKEVFDVTGAGDTVIATMSVALASGYGLKEAAVLSNKAAGVVVSKLGTAQIDIQSLNKQVASHSTSKSVYSEESLKQRIDQAKSESLTVVMTNGCFDLLHPGHVDYLEKAKALGDLLFVAVNDDASVRRLKGDTRPINPLSTRMKMLASLACVDGVVSFVEDTPERLYCNLLPNVLVKGGDYTPDQIAGADCVLRNQGKVMTLGFVDGHSSTEIIQKIKSS